MLLKRIIALKVIALLTVMIITVSTGCAVFAFLRHREMAVTSWQTRSLVLAEGLNRLMHWDDRVAIRQMLLSELHISEAVIYCFLVKDGAPYVHTFEKGVPLSLLQSRPPVTSQPVWEFEDSEGMVVYDLASVIDSSGTVLRIGLNRAIIDAKMQPLLIFIVLTGLLAIAVSVYMSFRIAQRTTREIDTLVAAIHRYGELNEETSGALTATTSEVSELVDSFKQLTTKKKAAELELANLNAQLEQRVAERTVQLTAANRELDSFAYSVSHDLRAPLRGIEGFSHILLEEYADKLDETAQEYLVRIRKGCVRMGRLIGDLLKLSRITRSEINRIPVNLTKLAEQVILDLQQGEPDRRVEVRIAAGMVANADLTLTRSVLENLLGNAWKFTRYTEQPLIEFSLRQQEGETVFCIKDNGAGFNMEYADKLFMAFQRLHRADEFEGSGIGLASVNRVLLMHGGRIWAEGEEGKGAVFYFTLGD